MFVVLGVLLFICPATSWHQDGKVKLIDFGTAKRFDLGPLTTKARRGAHVVSLGMAELRQVCTVHYVAPEVLRKSHGLSGGAKKRT